MGKGSADHTMQITQIACPQCHTPHEPCPEIYIAIVACSCGTAYWASDGSRVTAGEIEEMRGQQAMRLSYQQFEQIREHFTRAEQITLWIASAGTDPSTMHIDCRLLPRRLREKLQTLTEARAACVGT